ncbi:2559_t:CDS:2, partial [Entrophospora sp. SA101]
EGIKTGGYIDDFWVRNANIKDAEVSARIRDIEAKRINERSRNILNETIEEHNKASEALSDFANVEYNARKKRKQNHQSDRYTSPLPPSPKLRNLPIELSNPPSQKNNVYKNCNDLIRLGIFMKDSLDSAIDKGADIKIIGFQCIGFKLDFYIMDLTHGIYTMVHFGQVMFPASIKEMAAFVDEMETLLRIQEIFYESFNILYAKLCAPSPPSNKLTLKKNTLCTPKFRKLVNKTRDCNRSCPFWFRRF